MSHALDFTLGKAAIAYRASEGKPWHGFGGHISDDMNAAQIAQVAGVNYRVAKAPAFYSIPNPNFKEGDDESLAMLTRSYENRAVMYRTDTGDPLSVMSESHYDPAQPIELLEGLMGLVKGNGFKMDVAGALKGGRVVWGLAKREEGQGDIAGDIILPYILLLTSYDGTYARTARATSVRVVCQNTVSLSAVMNAQTTAKQRNSGEFDADKLFTQLGEFDSAFAEYVQAVKAMSKVRMTDDKLSRFFAKLYSPKALKDDSDWLRTELDFDREGVTSNQRNNVAQMVRLFTDSPGADKAAADGTLWGALNAVTFYQDHVARTKEGKRWESATIGNGNRAKDAAMSLALEML